SGGRAIEHGSWRRATGSGVRRARSNRRDRRREEARPLINSFFRMAARPFGPSSAAEEYVVWRHPLATLLSRPPLELRVPGAASTAVRRGGRGRPAFRRAL